MGSKKHFETSDNHSDSKMITNWYYNDFEECVDAIKKVAKLLDYSIININNDYFELLLKGFKFEIIIKITSFNPRESSIDFTLIKNSLFTPKPIDHVELWYSELKKILEFRGKGLHKNG